jgi:flagellin-like protein
MKTLRKIRKNAKALSPVVASIILIAVTVAVSIAVAAWMGALTVGFMGTEELKITKAEFPGTVYVDLTVRNTGTSPVTLDTSAYINGVAVTHNATSAAIDANSVVVVRLTNGANIQDGYNYEMKLLSTKGNTFTYTAVAPAS